MSEQTNKIIEHHLEAFMKGDADEIILDYTESSIVITPERTLKNLNEIYVLFSKFLTEVTPPYCDFVLSKKIIKDDVAYLIWSAESDDYKIPFATDTFFIKDDKIAAQTIAMILESKN